MSGRWLGLGALALFVVYFANVMVGAIQRSSPLSNVAELLVLLAAVILFVACVLRYEAAEKR